ncbi:hypothetical protein HDIA_3948 [Hartmannibacter diazotrophicus]|uniref:Uncharacterized protein n=1 Tax=Hartmannibacter diazotrophicus TaxID=1482074 RepID=A0A2C9DBE1_9HYPH|nr:hypothetical protein [Hartmannibacter diazotrophicus]SON57489.1 hypothetical protein HDIA_3948 [Hartmannibacter diazotrophicus]
MKTAIILLLGVLVIPLGLKQKVGDVKYEASHMQNDAAFSPRTMALLKSAGFELSRIKDTQRTAAVLPDCQILVSPLQSNGEWLAAVEEQSKTANRVTFLFKDRLLDEFPYRKALFAHYSYILTDSISKSSTYEPVVAISEWGACHELDKLRAKAPAPTS